MLLLLLLVLAAVASTAMASSSPTTGGQKATAETGVNAVSAVELLPVSLNADKLLPSSWKNAAGLTSVIEVCGSTWRWLSALRGGNSTDVNHSHARLVVVKAPSNAASRTHNDLTPCQNMHLLQAVKAGCGSSSSSSSARAYLHIRKLQAHPHRRGKHQQAVSDQYYSTTGEDDAVERSKLARRLREPRTGTSSGGSSSPSSSAGGISNSTPAGHNNTGQVTAVVLVAAPAVAAVNSNDTAGSAQAGGGAEHNNTIVVVPAVMGTLVNLSSTGAKAGSSTDCTVSGVMQGALT